ncbi:MAG: hypothetical protein MZV70_69580 [Desulfobacterales bacterium]|nr:hypothetical protein [Desulfobacterales bacterium]
MAPIGKTVLGGLTFGTLMTLFLMPAIYAVFNRKSEERAIRSGKNGSTAIAAGQRRPPESRGAWPPDHPEIPSGADSASGIGRRPGMKRVEIVANHSVQEDLMDALAEAGVARYHTLIPAAHGTRAARARAPGKPPGRRRDFVLFTYCEEAEARAIAEVVGPDQESLPRGRDQVLRIGG